MMLGARLHVPCQGQIGAFAIKVRPLARGLSAGAAAPGQLSAGARMTVRLSATRSGDFRANLAASVAGPGGAEGAPIMQRTQLSSLWFSAAILGLALDLSGCSREAIASSKPAA